MTDIRKCRVEDRIDILSIINDAAIAYKGIIPDDVWREPYMPAQELTDEMDSGVDFWCAKDGGQMVGVMGIQRAGDLSLIRHAYVETSSQRSGIGSELLKRLLEMSGPKILVGTWQDAKWAIRFYEKHGFAVQNIETSRMLLKEHWNITQRQVETSVVLQLVKPDINIRY